MYVCAYNNNDNPPRSVNISFLYAIAIQARHTHDTRTCGHSIWPKLRASRATANAMINARAYVEYVHVYNNNIIYTYTQALHRKRVTIRSPPNDTPKCTNLSAVAGSSQPHCSAAAAHIFTHTFTQRPECMRHASGDTIGACRCAFQFGADAVVIFLFSFHIGVLLQYYY